MTSSTLSVETALQAERPSVFRGHYGRTIRAWTRAGRYRNEGGIPFGWDRPPSGSRLLFNEVEHREILWMLARKDDGWSLARLTRELNKRGVPTKRGGRWWVTTVQRIIERTVSGDGGK